MTKWSYHNDKSDTILITIFRAHFVLAIIINHHPQNLQIYIRRTDYESKRYHYQGNDSNLLIVFYVQIMPDDFVMQLHRF